MMRERVVAEHHVRTDGTYMAHAAARWPGQSVEPRKIFIEVNGVRVRGVQEPGTQTLVVTGHRAVLEAGQVVSMVVRSGDEAGETVLSVVRE